MYAIIESGGFQFKVASGDILTVPKIEGGKGDKMNFPRVLFFRDGDRVEAGMPYLNNVKVEGEILRHIKGRKVISFRYRRREQYKRRKGFRGEFSEVKITNIAEGL